MMKSGVVDSVFIKNEVASKALIVGYIKQLIADGNTPQGAEEICLRINEDLNDPPLPKSYVRRIIKPYLNHGERLSRIAGLGCSIELDRGVIQYAKFSPKRPFLFGVDIAPMGTLSVIGGLGGSGKSQAAMQMLAAAAIGGSYAGRPSDPTCGILIGFEDSQEEINARFSAIMEGFSDAQRDLLKKNIRAISMVGKGFNLVSVKGRNAEPTGYSDLLIAKIIELKEVTNLDRAVLVIDHARLMASVDWNDAAQVTVLTTELIKISHDAGAAVILIAHSPKNTASPDHEVSQADIAGSSALVDNARYVGLVRGMSPKEAKDLGVKSDTRDNYIKFECVKSNYSKKGLIGWFIKTSCANHHVATHTYVEPCKTIPTKEGDSADESKVIKYIRANPNLTLTDLRKRAGKNGVLGLSDLKIRDIVNTLLEKGLLAHVPPTANYTKKTTPQFKGVLGVTSHV